MKVKVYMYGPKQSGETLMLELVEGEVERITKEQKAELLKLQKALNQCETDNSKFMKKALDAEIDIESRKAEFAVSLRKLFDCVLGTKAKEMLIDLIAELEKEKI